MQATVYLVVGQSQAPASRTLLPKIYAYETVHEYPHDASAFTQGLEYDKNCTMGSNGAQTCVDRLWESTGKHSWLGPGCCCSFGPDYHHSLTASDSILLVCTVQAQMQ